MKPINMKPTRTKSNASARCALLFATILAINTPIAAQIINIEAQRIPGTNDSTRWYGTLRGAANLVKVREQSLLLHAEARTQWRAGRKIALLLLNSDFLRAGNNNFTNAHFAHLRYNYHLWRSVTVEAFGQVQQNRLLLLRARALAGTGLRWRPYRSASGKSRAYLGASLMQEWNTFVGTEAPARYLRSSMYASITLRTNAGALLQGTAYYQPVLGLASNYRFSTEWALELPLIGKKLAFSSSFNVGLDNALPAAAPLRTYAWRNGIVWRLI
jgi:hypothetical protein